MAAATAAWRVARTHGREGCGLGRVAVSPSSSVHCTGFGGGGGGGRVGQQGRRRGSCFRGRPSVAPARGALRPARCRRGAARGGRSHTSAQTRRAAVERVCGGGAPRGRVCVVCVCLLRATFTRKIADMYVCMTCQGFCQNSSGCGQMRKSSQNIAARVLCVFVVGHFHEKDVKRTKSRAIVRSQWL